MEGKDAGVWRNSSLQVVYYFLTSENGGGYGYFTANPPHTPEVSQATHSILFTDDCIWKWLTHCTNKLTAIEGGKVSREIMCLQYLVGERRTDGEKTETLKMWNHIWIDKLLLLPSNDNTSQTSYGEIKYHDTSSLENGRIVL